MIILTPRRSARLTNNSDILAELDIPRSGIQDIQDVAYPKGFVDQPSLFHAQNNKEKIMIYYSFQLYMRKTLNDIQRDLYQESMFRSRFCSCVPDIVQILTTA